MSGRIAESWELESEVIGKFRIKFSIDQTLTEIFLYRSGQTYVVCNYDPPGNFIGSFSENVPPVGGFPIPKIVIDKSYDSDTPEDFTDFAKAMLKHHNDFRKRHAAHELR